jgi:hypothetical protein
MHRIGTITVIAALAALSLAPSAAAQGRGRRKAPEKRAAQPARATRATVQFTASDRDHIVKYFAHHPYKAKDLPPGIAKNLVRGKLLPPGIAKHRLPAALVAQLPRRSGVTITIVGDRLVLLNDRGLVVDIMVNVF